MRVRISYVVLLGLLSLSWIIGGLMGSLSQVQNLVAPPEVDPTVHRIASVLNAGALYVCTGGPVLLLCASVLVHKAWRASLSNELRYMLEDRTILSNNLIQARLHEELRHFQEGETQRHPRYEP
jgi:hypothetical protein